MFRGILSAAGLAAAMVPGMVLADGDYEDRYPKISGNIGLYLGLGDYSECANCNFGTMGGWGRAQVRFNPVWAVQLDGIFESWHNDFQQDSWNIMGIVGHANYRIGEGFRVGGYLGRMDAEWDSRHTLAGVEGQAYFGKFTLEGRVGGYWTDDDDIFTAYAALRYFPQDNLKLEVSAFYDSFTWDDSGAGIGLKAEYRFGDLPVSVFAAIDHGWYNDQFPANDFSLTTGSVGVTFSFRERSLRSGDQMGASFGQGLLFPVRIAD